MKPASIWQRLQPALAAFILLLAAACSPAAPAILEASPSPAPAASETPAPTRTPPPTATEAPTQAPAGLEEVVSLLEAAYGLEVNQIQTTEIEAVEWRDSCLDAAHPGEMCLQVITPGYRVVLDTPLGEFEIHTDQRGANLRLVSGPTGIAGQALLGPACPVMTEGTECADQPYQATIVILGPSGQALTQIETDEQGKFQLPLPPGEYTLAPVSGDPLPTAGEQQVTVPPDGYTQVIIQYDSGIR
jgi:hypothetical protein